VRFAATVFDLDETLVDSGPAWNRVITAVAARHGHGWTAADWAAIRGRDMRHWGGYLAERGPGLTAESAIAECAAGMVAELDEGCFGLLPGAAELVAVLAERGPVALVSASPGRYVHAAVAASGLRFDAVVAGEDVVRGKPAPDPYLLAAHRLGVRPGDCLAVEDSGSGIRSAHAAGMTVLAIPNPATAGDLAVLELADHQAADAEVAVKMFS
jgi:beta-phosphoglucomutase-like phosphatase (HAD superfamily)